MNNIYFICFASLLFGACSGQSQPEPVKPNIIIIMADDLGYGGISSYGEPVIETPELDTLARNGIRFTDFHANAPVCTPTRAALLTFDGVDFSNVLFEKAGPDERTVFWRYRDQKAARKGQWKLLITESDTALYNLEQDLKETTDLSDKHQSVLGDLIKQLKNWEREVGQNSEMKTL